MKIFSLVMMALLAGVLLSGCSSSSEDSATAETAAKETTPPPAPAGKGAPAPDFTLARLDGSELQLSSLKGKAVIIDFWDTWCPPCIKAMPHLQELSVEYAGELVVVGVALGREGQEKVQAFTDKNGITFDVVMFNNDPNLITAFGGIQSIPTTFLVDGNGIIREKWVGGFGKAEYERAVKEVLGS